MIRVNTFYVGWGFIAINVNSWGDISKAFGITRMHARSRLIRKVTDNV